MKYIRFQRGVLRRRPHTALATWLMKATTVLVPAISACHLPPEAQHTSFILSYFEYICILNRVTAYSCYIRTRNERRQDQRHVANKFSGIVGKRIRFIIALRILLWMFVIIYSDIIKQLTLALTGFIVFIPFIQI